MLTVATEPLLTVEETAKRLRISKSAVYNLITAEELEMVPIYGRKRRVLASSIDSYLERRRISG
jgi:excisionase family DNA binding protein